MGWVFLAAYTLSGVAGLVYEVSWTRLLSLAMGHGLAASSTVLAAFMGGLALGAVVAGRLSPRLSSRHALQAYAALEALIALLALAFPLTLDLVTPLFAAAYHEGSGGALFGLTRLAACLLVLLPPAMALGATFPLAVRAMAEPSLHRGRSTQIAGRLYAANTVGAAIGAVLSGFVLVPALGGRGTAWVGVAASLAAGALVLVVVRSRGASPPVDDGAAPTARRAHRAGAAGFAGVTDPPQFGLALALVAITGFVTFSAEVAWTRVFALIVGPSTYAFAATIAAFISGLAIGATVGTVIAARTRRPALASGVVLGLSAIAAAWTTAAAGTSIPRQVMTDFAAAPAGALLLSHALLVALLIVPAAIGIGAAFPLAFQVAARAEAPAQRVAAIYAVNTLTSVAGSLVTGFILVPWLGLEPTLQLIAALIGMASVVAILSGHAPWRWRAAAVVPAVIAGGLLLSSAPWDRELLASGSYKYASDVTPGLAIETALRAGQLLYYKDGPTGTVSVKQLTGHRSLAIDGKVDASTAGDMLTQKLLAHLPLLLHEQPHDVAIIGLGSGATLAAALTHPLRTVDVLEISGEVAEASRLFTGGRPSPLDDPRTRLVVADGRTHMALTTRQYDVIVSEPSNPWMAGVAALFTREFFSTASRRLAARGIMCQWVNTYDISTDDLRSVVATFSAVFPHGTMWLVGEGDLLLLGSQEAFESRLPQLTRSWQRTGVAADLAAVSVREPFGILSMFAGNDAAIARFRGSSAVQTDDRMALEFSAPRALRTATRPNNVAQLRAAAAAAPPPAVIVEAWQSADGVALAHRAAMLRQATAYEPAYQAALDAVEKSPSSLDAWLTLVDTAVPTGRQRDTLTHLAETAARHPDLAAPQIARSRLLAGTGSLDEAARAATVAVQIAPGDPQALEQLASVFADAGDLDRLAPVVAALAAHAERAGSHYYAGALAFMRGDLVAAQAAAQRALTTDPRHARAQNLLGAIAATQGQTETARAAFAKALELEPRDPSTYQNLALLELHDGHAAVAARLFAEALSLDPSSVAARDGLARAGVP